MPAAAERVFWFHWSEGARNGDWCSQFALHFIARQCEVDTSTVTRAYQVLKRLGLIRRTDPGRDAANPFEQATCITEVLLPPEMLAELQASPNRPSPRDPPARSGSNTACRWLRRRRPGLRIRTSIWTLRSAGRGSRSSRRPCRPRNRTAGTRPFAARREAWTLTPIRAYPRRFRPKSSNTWRLAKRRRTWYQRRRRPPPAAPPRPRRLSVFDIARLRHGLQKIGSVEAADELTRQVLWSIEAGSLRQFGVMHAVNIALKKIREGQWTRPHRMPPNWLRKLSDAAQPETCSGA